MRDFLTHLAIERKVSAATQHQAFNALLFLFRNYLRYPLARHSFPFQHSTSPPFRDGCPAAAGRRHSTGAGAVPAGEQ